MRGVDPAWLAANHRYLTSAIRCTEARIEAALAQRDGQPPSDALARALGELERAAAAMPAPAALERITTLFALSPFQRELLQLIAAVELSSTVGQMCASLLGDPRRTCATFGLALWLLPGAHWSALAPSSPLRRWHMIEVESGPLTTAALRIDERMLHELAGVPEPDERLRALVRPVESAPPPYAALVEQVARCLRTDAKPVVAVAGGSAASRVGVACQALADAGWPALRVTLPDAVPDRSLLVTLIEREVILHHAGLVLEQVGTESPDRQACTQALVESVWPVAVTSATAYVTTRPTVQFQVPPLSVDDRRALWLGALGPAAAGVGAVLDELIAEFRTSPEEIVRFGTEWQVRAAAGEVAPPAAEHPLRARLRAENRPPFAGLAQVIIPSAEAAELVLPDAQAELVAQIELHVRYRDQVLDGWGFGRRDGRGLGIAALFHGPSGTGKTLAAEVIARRLGFDLVRVDLSQIVSKYIGETEKNLARVFDAADRGGCVLLFDEADALFGKRSEVRDSHDRYANIEVGYLLQRIEAFRGLAILTTNLKQSLDPAFLRRLRFVVAFPFPDVTERRRIWERVLPLQAPRGDLDLDRVARLQVTGGNIRNIALHAAFLAAAEATPITMRHLLRASRDECVRIEKSVSSAEIGGWQ